MSTHTHQPQKSSPTTGLLSSKKPSPLQKLGCAPVATTVQRATFAPGTLSQQDVIQLQRTIGNRAVSQLLAGVVQRRAGGHPQKKDNQQDNGELDLEVAAVEGLSANKGMNEAPAQLKSEQPVAASHDSSVRAVRDNGLPQNLQSGIQSLSGISMEDVNVHYNSGKPAQLQALAYAQGSNIYVAPGQEKHLPHEAWHVVQQKQGRVQATMQLHGAAINADTRMEREADEMGTKAAQGRTIATPESLTHTPTPASDVIQPRLGFEIEMLALVDINGRPIPEKTDLGTYGANNLELTVDHGPAVAAPTPTNPGSANFTIPGLAPLGPYDTPIGTETRMTGGVDPRPAVAINLLDLGNWTANTAGIVRTRIRRPDNRPFAQIDALIPNYRRFYDNYDVANAMATLVGIQLQIQNWRTANPHAVGSGWLPSHLRRRNRWNASDQALTNLSLEVHRHRNLWLANPNPPVGMNREYRQPAGGMGAMGTWQANHPLFQPQEGMGTDRYASILEIVTPGGAGYEPETVAGRGNIVAAMTQAVALAQAIEAATGNFAHRVRLNTIAGVATTSPDIYVGNTHQPAQTTDASLQSTMAVDLSHMASFFKSTLSGRDMGGAHGGTYPQTEFSLKHHADTYLANRVDTEAARSPNVAKRAIRDAPPNGMGVVAGAGPALPNLRGLITLMCQYLLMGRYFFSGGGQRLDKNIVPLLSRNDLGMLFNTLVRGPERAWVATGGNLAALRIAILNQTQRTGPSMLFNNPAENQPAGGALPYNLTSATFINNILTGNPDGVTAHLGGFRQFASPEVIDPLATRHADPRRAGREREGAIFEMRNMMPHDSLNLGTQRFTHNRWIGVATYMANMLAALHARTQAQAQRDTKYRQAVGGTVDEAADW